MRLVGYATATRMGVGALLDGRLVDLSCVAKSGAELWQMLMEKGGAKALSQTLADVGDEHVVCESWRHRPFAGEPNRILCIGLNYIDHARETGLPVPEHPIVFTRYTKSFVGHREDLVLPKESSQFDFEGELAVVIGRRGRRIREEEALSHVAGYSVINEGSIRDYQFRSSQWTLGKNFEGSGAAGPYLVTADELPEGPGNLRITTRLNGQVVQDATTTDMIFGVERLIATVSEVMTLEPGDVIATGTPPGVGIGRTPPLFMKAGDTCEIEIERVGTLSNRVGPAG